MTDVKALMDECERMRVNERNALSERDRLRAENARLREIVSDMFPRVDWCRLCEHKETCGLGGFYGTCPTKDAVVHAMRIYGIEAGQ